ncbi:MAG: response regulator transcription factor [Nitrospira sp.]
MMRSTKSMVRLPANLLNSERGIPVALPMIRVLVVAADEIVCVGLRGLLRKAGDIQVIGDVRASGDVLNEVNRLKPDVVLFDLQLSGMKGRDVVRQLCLQDHQPKIFVLIEHDTEEAVYGAVTSGAQGIVLKDFTGDDLAHAIRSVMGGRSFLDPQVAERALAWLRANPPVLPMGAVSRLSKPEESIVKMIVDGLTNKQISEKSGMARSEVQRCLTILYRRLGITSRSRLAAWYVSTYGRMRGNE